MRSMKAKSIPPNRKPGESYMEFLNRVGESWEDLVKSKMEEEGAFYQELRKEKGSTDSDPAEEGKTREALLALLALHHPETDLAAVQGKIKALDEMSAMKAVLESPRFGLPGPSWR